MNIRIGFARNKEEMKQVMDIRKRVFIEEQGVPERRERDGLDGDCEHLIIRNGESAIGTARIMFKQNKAKTERFAVLKEYRRRGIGKRFFEFITDYCKRKGVDEMFFSAQLYLKDFYIRLGFKTRGKVFKDANIDHIQMYMKFRKGGEKA